jgi:hypothetical protein
VNFNAVGWLVPGTCEPEAAVEGQASRIFHESGWLALCSVSFLKYSGTSISVIENKRAGGDILARSKFQSEKRQKELAKKKKQEEKRQRKLEKNTVSPDDNPDQPQDAAESPSAEGNDVLINP